MTDTAVNTVVDATTRFAIFDKFCDDKNCVSIAQLYIKTLGKDTFVKSIFRLVNKTEPARTENGIPEWDYKRYKIQRVKDTTNGIRIIQVNAQVGDDQTYKMIFKFAHVRVYNKTCERVYYYMPNGFMMDVETQEQIMSYVLNENTPTMRRFVFDELMNHPMAPNILIDNITTCDFEILLTKTYIECRNGIKTDFTIKYLVPLTLDSTNDDVDAITVKTQDLNIATTDVVVKYKMAEIRVHKFVLACISNYFKRLIYGSGDIKGVDEVDLSGFPAKTVEWFAEFIYHPKLTMSCMTDDDWALFDYINIDIRALKQRACAEIGLI